jgi:hypothetical protein
VLEGGNACLTPFEPDRRKLLVWATSNAKIATFAAMRPQMTHGFQLSTGSGRPGSRCDDCSGRGE